MIALGTAVATALTTLGAAKIRSGASGRAAELTTDAANRAAQLDRQTAADQLAYVRNQARMDRESQRWADRQNYGLSRAEGLNTFARFGDTAFNARASEVATEKQLDTMRALMGMPNKELVSYVEPDALRLTAPVLPPYVEDPTQDTVDDDTGVDPMTKPNRRA